MRYMSIVDSAGSLDRVFALMKKLLCVFVMALSVCVYPVFLRVPIEISQVFGIIEFDTFSWYRMWLITLVGILFIVFTGERISKPIRFIWFALVVSVIWSKFYRTSLFGSPWMHEGFIVAIGYMGVYLASRKFGLFKGLERAFDAVVVIAFLFSILQITYGNFALFPPIKWVFPLLKYEISYLPLYSVFGHWNHLGLFCALFYPYTVLKKKYFLVAMILLMAIGSQSRGAWVSMGVMTLLMGRQVTMYAAVACLFLSLPFYKSVIPRIKNTLSDLHYPIRDKDLTGRAYIWKNSIPQLKETLIIGNGPGNFAMKFPQHEYQEFYGEKIIDRPHNIYLQMWINSGLISLIVFSLCVTALVVNGTDPSLKMGVIGFLICGLFTDSVLSVTPYFIIFLGCLSHNSRVFWGRVFKETEVL